MQTIGDARTYVVLGAYCVRQSMGSVAELQNHRYVSAQRYRLQAPDLVLEYLPARRVLHQPRYLRPPSWPGLMSPVEYELRYSNIVGDEWRGLLGLELHG